MAKKKQKITKLEADPLKDVAVAEVVEAVEVVENESPWYVFCSTGCGFCKKAEPVVEALNNEGYDILVLDMAEPDNQKLNKELQTEYGARCGTPWFINAETGKGICGYREKDVVKKWLDGEDIPEPPRPKGPMPRVPFNGATDQEEKAWRGEYATWLEDNAHLPDTQKRPADDILASPRASREAPRPPMGADATDADIDAWGDTLRVWQEENTHLSGMQPVHIIVSNFKKRRDNMLVAEGTAAPKGTPPSNVPTISVGKDDAGRVGQPITMHTSPETFEWAQKLNSIEARFTALEVKLDKIVTHFGIN